jgi:hypothetical protein
MRVLHFIFMMLLQDEGSFISFSHESVGQSFLELKGICGGTLIGESKGDLRGINGSFGFVDKFFFIFPHFFFKIYKVKKNANKVLEMRFQFWG